MTKPAASQTEIVPAIMLQQDVLNVICEKLEARIARHKQLAMQVVV
jgi:hypothetical protein